MARKKQQSDEALLDSAMPAIFSKGPQEFTLADVAQATGLSPATFIQRFGSKQGLVVAALELTNRRNFESLLKLPPGKGVEAVVRVFVERTPGPEYEQLLSDQLLWLRESMANPRINALSREYFVKFREAIAERMPELRIPAEQAVLLIEAQWHGALTQWGIGREGHLRDYVERSLRNWFILVGASP
ncbi:MAG TPA: helix-turn-helix domain-containing protein [Sphingomicrobium sp.]|jgi:AcrR family transcriptional regulator|nr:helix-turn-helix domain-containing protein [Sphingomicrobium sp.]